MAEKIKIEAVISIIPEKVWMAWTNPEHITKWNFANDDWQCPWATNDLRAGGSYIARMEAKDGSIGFDFEAIYDEVVEFKKLVYTLSDGRKVVTEFERIGDTTKVSTVFEAEAQNSLDLQKNGWQAILNSFQKYTEKNLVKSPV